MTPLPRIGLIGLGDIGVNHHLPALLRSEGIELVALADTADWRRQGAREVLAGHPATIFEDAEQLLEQNLDGVVLATPPWVTPGLALTALDRGLFVLAEKPLAVDLSAAHQLSAMPESLAARYQLGLTYRHDLAIERLREAVANGELGAGPLLVDAQIFDEAYRQEDAEHYGRILGALEHGDPSVHEGAHIFDWLYVILDARPEVQDAYSLTTRNDLPAPNIVGTRLSYPGGTVANVHFGWLVEVLPPAHITVTGDLAHAHLDLASFDLTITSRARTEKFVQEQPKMERCFDRQLESFVELVTGRRDTPSVGIRDGIESLVVANQIAELLGASSRNTKD